MSRLKRAISGAIVAAFSAASLLAFSTPAQAASVTVATNASSNTFTAPTAPVTPSLSGGQPMAFSYPGGIFEVGAPSAGSSTLSVNAYKNGALDTTFNSTGSVSFTSQLITTDRSSLSMTTYASGTKWAILDANSSVSTGYNYLYLGTFSSGYQSTITLPTTGSNYTTCTNKLNAISNGIYTSYGGSVELIENTGFAAPLLNIGCQIFVTANGSTYTSKANFLVNYSGGTTLGTPATFSSFGGTASASPVNQLNTTTKKTITNFGVSVNPAATGSTIALTFLDAVASSTSYANTMDYDSTAYTDFIITRVSANGMITQTTGAWTSLLAGSRTGTVFVPPRNSGMFFAVAHATDGTSAVTKILAIDVALAATASTVTGLTLTASLNRIAPMVTPGNTIKIASVNNGSASYYYEIDRYTAVITQVSTFTTSGGFAFSDLMWAMADNYNGVDFYVRASATSILRVWAQPAPTVPGMPTGVGGVEGNTEFWGVWTAPTSSGGAAITGYQIQVTTNGGISYTLWGTVGPTTSAVITGLTNGLQYQFRVAAVNSVGVGPWSIPSSGILLKEVPTQPQVTSVVYASSTSATVTWNTPADGGHPILHYNIAYSPDNGAGWYGIGTQGPITTNSFTVPGLTSFTSYIFRVTATNSAGTSLFVYSSQAYFVADLPGAPLAPTATVADSQSVVSWSAPAANGCAITAYKIEYSTNNAVTWYPISGTYVTTSATVINLTNGLTYRFRVAAQNCDGWGAFSPASASVTPNAVPSAPTGLTIAGGVGNQTFALSWSAVNSSFAVTDYLIEYASSAAGPWSTYADGVSTTTSANVGTFALGSTVVFRVSAINAIGTGSPSAVSASYVAAAVPAAPAAPTGTSTPGQATITWVPPVNANAPLTGASLFYSTNGTTWISYNGSVDTSGTIQITSLPGGQNYFFKVQASNYFGSGAQSVASAAVFVQAATAPAAVSQLTAATGSSAGTIDLAWTAPAANGSPITNYVIEYSDDGGLTWTTFPHPTSTNTLITVTGLTAGSAYQFRVNAVNAIGTGASMSQASTAVNAAATPSTPSNSTAEFLASLKTNPNINTNEGKFDLTGTNLDQITQIFLNQVEAKITYRTAEIMTIALPAEVLGWVDVTFVMKGSIIRFDRFMYVAKSISGVTRLGIGYKTIGYPRGKAPQISTNTLKANAVVRFANVIPKAANAKQATCIGYVGKGMTARESLARARDTCTLVSLRYPRIVTKVAVSKSILRAHVLVLFNY